MASHWVLCRNDLRVLAQIFVLLRFTVVCDVRIFSEEHSKYKRPPTERAMNRTRDVTAAPRLRALSDAR